MASGNMHQVVAIRTDAEGRLAQFKLEDGTVVNKKECEQLIHDGQLDLVCTKGRSGTTVIRAKQDQKRLVDLPTF